MNLGRSLLLAAVLIAASAAVGVWGYRELPPGAVIATHFNLAGQANGFASKPVGLATIPVIGALVIAVLAAAPSLMPNREAPPTGAYGLVMIGVAAMFLVAQAGLVVHALDPDFDVLRWIAYAAGVFLVVLGALLGRLRPNGLIGIRTPWTLGDPGVWNRTHRFAGRLFVLGGVALAAIAYFLGADHTDVVAALVLCAVVPAVVAAFYSRAIYQAPAEG